jgi:pimeloyl-ACP methyl ester carboxylesterase
MPFVESDEARVYYEVHGSGPALVLSHGADGNTLTWWQQVAYFREYYTVIVWDARGFGRTTCPPEAQDIQLLSKDLGAVLDDAGIERAALVGHSLGGYSSLPFALNHPERVSCLVLSGSPAAVRLRGSERAALRLLAKMDRGLTPQELYLSASFRKRQPDWALLFDQINGLNPPRPTLDDRGGRTRSVFVEPSELESFTIPVLAIAGSEDPNYYVQEVSELAQLVGAKLTVIDGAGHPSYFENPATFNRCVHEFLELYGWV